MNVFCHINELRDGGWRAVRTMLLSCEKLILWSPSAAYLAELRKRDKTLPTNEELLGYIRSGKIQILAREWWLTNDQTRRRHKWEYA